MTADETARLAAEAEIARLADALRRIANGALEMPRPRIRAIALQALGGRG